MHILILGATSAIAHAFAKRYAKEGNHVFTLMGRNQQRLNACASELSALGNNVIDPIVVDFMNASEIIQAINKSIQSVGSIQIAVLAQGSLSDQERASAQHGRPRLRRRRHFLQHQSRRNAGPGG